MDPNEIEKNVRARFDHRLKKLILKEKYQAKLTFAYNGGMFKTSPEMMAFLNLYGDTTIVVSDIYENPIEISAAELCNMMKIRWQEQMNFWLIEHRETQNKR